MTEEMLERPVTTATVHDMFEDALETQARVRSKISSKLHVYLEVLTVFVFHGCISNLIWLMPTENMRKLDRKRFCSKHVKGSVERSLLPAPFS